MAKPIVSIIVPNHNYAQYIADAIASIRAQTLRDWECFIIDDASTDDSVAVIKKSIRGDKRFKLIKFTEPVGVSRARNAGLDAATGDFIAFLDSDDCYTEYALEMLVNLAQSMDADIAGGQTMGVPATFKFIPKKNTSIPVGKCWIRRDPTSFLFSPKEFNWVWVWRRIYRRELLEKVRFIPEFTSVGDDIGFMLDLCYRTYRIVETANMTVFHRGHFKSVMHEKFDTRMFYFFPVLLRHIRDNLLDKYPTRFLRRLYPYLFNYMIFETVIHPKQIGQYQAEGKQVLLESVRYIPRRYLPLRKRFLCWFLTCLK